MTQVDPLGRTTTYAVDALDRLMQATYPTSTVTYTLDSVTNRLWDSMTGFAIDNCQSPSSQASVPPLRRAMRRPPALWS